MTTRTKQNFFEDMLENLHEAESNLLENAPVLQKRLNDFVTSEVTAIYHQLNQPWEDFNEAFIERFKKSNNKNLTVKESRQYLKEELAFVAPNNFVRLIDAIFNKEHLSIIQSRYEEIFHAFHKENDFQQIINRHKVSNPFFQALYHDLMKQAEQLKEPLQNFSKDYVHLLETLKNVQNNRDDDLFVVGAGILGTVFAGPVGGMATREFLRGSNGLEAEMKRAIGKVYDGIILILKRIDACLGSLYKRLVYFHYVLWYGFLKKIKADFIDLGYDLKDINFETKK